MSKSSLIKHRQHYR